MKQEQNSLFTQQLKTLWMVETMLTEYIPLLVERAKNYGLQKNLSLHFAETTQHKVAIEAICKQLDIYPRQGGDATVIQEILDDSEKKIEESQEEAFIDAAIISCAVEIEQYEIQAYEIAAQLAKQLGYNWIAKRLYLTCEEEKQAFTKLKFLESRLQNEPAGIRS